MLGFLLACAGKSNQSFQETILRAVMLLVRHFLSTSKLKCYHSPLKVMLGKSEFVSLSLLWPPQMSECLTEATLEKSTRVLKLQL